MLETNRIDLAIPANQNKLIFTFSEYFSEDELDKINYAVRHIKCIASDTAHEACHGMETNVQFDNSFFDIKCKLDDNVMPPIHHICITVAKEGQYETIINCNPDIRNPIYLCRIIARSINFSKFKEIDDIKYNRRSILGNVAQKISELINDVDALIHFRGKIATDLYNNLAYEQNGMQYEIDYNEKYFVSCTWQFGDIIDIQVKTEDEIFTWYIPQTDVGMNLLLLALDKAIIKIKTKLYID